MKNPLPLAALALLVATTSGTAYAERVNLKKASERQTKETLCKEEMYRTDVIPSPLKTMNQEPSVDQKSVVLFEDFNNVPDGETETIGDIGERQTTMIASHYFEPGQYIPDEYTPESGTWEGDWIYAGKNGTVIMQCYNPQMPAHLCTPLGDYSGDLTVTMRVRAVPAFWGVDNELGYGTSTGTDLLLYANIGGYDSGKPANSEIKDWGLQSSRFYLPYGWQEVTFKFRNESADSNGYLSIYCSDALEIDWIKVTDDNTFLACPTLDPITNVTEDSFTINWQPVRRSCGYYIDLYEAVYTGEGVNATYDFNDMKLPEGASADECEFIEGEGIGSSAALALGYDGEGAAFITPDYGMTLESFMSNVKFKINDPSIYGAQILYDGLGENGWEQIGYIEYDGYWVAPDRYYDINLNGEKFADRYSAVRIYTKNLADGDRVYIDNVNAYKARPFELKRMEGSSISDPDDDEFGYNYFDYTYDFRDPCSYTFKDLNPETEYWYRVRSHYMYDFSFGEKHHAFFVKAPELLPATNVSNGSYTANWKDVPKAQNYIVTNYAVEKMDSYDKYHTIIAEEFTGCTGETDLASLTPLGNNETSSLDEYTANPGWTGSGNIVGENLLGVAEYSYGFITTPPIYANPERGECTVYVEAIGYPGDQLLVYASLSDTKGTIPFDENGLISAAFLIENPVPGDKISFESYNYMSFAMGAFELIQEAEEGDLIRSFHSTKTIGAGIGSCVFSNLDPDGIYAYEVISKFDLEKETALSLSPGWMMVNLADGNSSIITGIDEIETDVSETERFTVDGRKVSKDYKGIVIVRMSDGKVVKKIQR